jgi:flagellar hook assembly protein FlgD
VDHGLFLSTNQFDIYPGATLVVSYILPKAGSFELRVYNVRGRTIRHLCDGNESAGRHTATWDGMDDLGQKVNSGLYLVTLRYNDVTTIKKVVAIRH